MSQKNFASYGDMETLFTEIGEKLGNKGGKLYLHTIKFAIKSVKEMVDEDEFEDSFRNNKTAVAIGVHKIGLNGTWEELIIDGTNAIGGPSGSVITDIKNGSSDYIGSESSYSMITVRVLSRTADPFTSLNSLNSAWSLCNIIASLNPRSYNYYAEGITYMGHQQGPYAIFHIDPEISGSSYMNYVDKWQNGGEEAILLLEDTKIKNFSDTVSVWI